MSIIAELKECIGDYSLFDKITGQSAIDEILYLRVRIKQLEEALAIAMIGGDYLESERRQLNIVLKGK